MNTDEDIKTSEIIEKFDEEATAKKKLKPWNLKLIAFIAISWSLFQLWYASPFPFMFDIGMFKGLPARAIHLGFALTLAFLIYPISKRKKISIFDILISFIAAFCCLYIYFFYDQLVDRGGILLTVTIWEKFNLPVEVNSWKFRYLNIT